MIQFYIWWDPRKNALQYGKVRTMEQHGKQYIMIRPSAGSRMILRDIILPVHFMRSFMFRLWIITDHCIQILKAIDMGWIGIRILRFLVMHLMLLATSPILLQGRWY